MYPCTLQFAQAFEFQIIFKKQMAFSEYHLDMAGLGSWSEFYHNSKLQDPFKDRENCHPVEGALMRTKLAMDIDDIPAFNEARADVINYLEPGYQRIVDALWMLNEFIKENKRPRGFSEVLLSNEARHCNPDHHRERAKPLVLLEQYANSFIRDMPWAIKAEIRIYQRFYNHYYVDQPIQSLLHEAICCFRC